MEDGSKWTLIKILASCDDAFAIFNGVEHALALAKFNSTFEGGREREHRNEIVNHVRYCGGNSVGGNVCRAPNLQKVTCPIRRRAPPIIKSASPDANEGAD